MDADDKQPGAAEPDGLTMNFDGWMDEVEQQLQLEDHEFLSTFENMAYDIDTIDI
jgi:hypothetical protein